MAIGKVNTGYVPTTTRAASTAPTGSARQTTNARQTTAADTFSGPSSTAATSDQIQQYRDQLNQSLDFSDYDKWTDDTYTSSNEDKQMYVALSKDGGAVAPQDLLEDHAKEAKAQFEQFVNQTPPPTPAQIEQKLSDLKDWMQSECQLEGFMAGQLQKDLDKIKDTMKEVYSS